MGTKTVSANASQTWATDKDPMAYGSYRVTAVAMVGTLKVTKTQDIKLTGPTATTFTF